MGWLTGWQYRAALTVDGTVPGLSGAISNRPLIVAIPAALKAVCQAAGQDVRITTADGATLCPYGIEDWSAAAPVVHFQAPSVAATSTTFYAYGGNAGASDAQAKSSVPDANAKIYLPMSDAASPAVDWTTNANDAAQSGGVTFGATGRSAQGCSFDGTDDHLSTGDRDSLDWGTADFSLEAWLFIPNGTAQARRLIVDKRALIAQNAVGYIFGVNNDDTLNADIRDVNNVTRAIPGANAVSYGAWHHAAVSLDRDATAQLYLDGAPTGAAVDISAVTGSLSNGGECVLGYHDPLISSSWGRFKGTLDQMVFAAFARSADWIKCSAKNYVGSAMFAWGALEGPVAPSMLMGANLGKVLIHSVHGGLLK